MAALTRGAEYLQLIRGWTASRLILTSQATLTPPGLLVVLCAWCFLI